MAVAAADLEDTATKIAHEIVSRHDQLRALRQCLEVEPLGKLEEYLQSQKCGLNVGYCRSDSESRAGLPAISS